MNHQVKVGKQNQRNLSKGWASWPVDTRSRNLVRANADQKGGIKWFKTKDEAEGYALEINAQQRTGGVAVAGEAGTIQAACEIYVASLQDRIERGTLAYASAAVMITNAESWIPALGHLKVDEVIHNQIQPVLDGFTGRTPRSNKSASKPLSHKTKRDKLTQLSRIFAAARDQGWLSFAHDPTTKVELKKKKHRKGEAAARKSDGLEKFDKSEIIEAIEYAMRMDSDWCDGLAVAFAFQTGLRFGEHCALRWCDLDMDKKRVSVVVAKRKAGRGGQFEVGVTKTKLSRRVVPLTPQLIALLKAWKLRSPYSKEDDLVFPTRRGTYQYDSGNWRSRYLHPACDAVGIDRLRWHDMRHFFASVLLDSFGTDWARIADLMGHDSTDFTRRQYGHWIEPEAAEDEQASDELGAAFFG